MVLPPPPPQANVLLPSNERPEYGTLAEVSPRCPILRGLSVYMYGTDPGENVSRHVRDKRRELQGSGDQSVGPARRADQDTLPVHDVVDIAN